MGELLIMRLTAVFLLSLWALVAKATPYANTAFMKQPPAAGLTLAFTSTANTGLVTWTCTGVTTVETRSGGSPQNVGSNTTINLTGPTGVRFYSDASCLNEITSVVVTTGTSSASFYFQAGRLGNPTTLTAAASGYTSATQNQTVTAYLGCTWLGGTTAWATTSNWSCGRAPTNVAADLVVFDSNCTNCNPAAPGSNQTLYGVYLTPDYTGTWNNSNRNFTFSGGGSCRFYGGTFTQGSGTFSCTGQTLVRGGTVNGGTASMTMNGGLTISSGTVTMNANAANSLSSNSSNGFQMSGGTFTGGGGTFNFSSTSANNTMSGGTRSGGAGNITFAGNFTVSGGSFTTSSGQFNLSSSNRDLTVSGGTFVQAGILNGTGNLVVSSGTFTGATQGITFRDVTISGGTTTATSGTFIVTRNMTVTGTPTFNHNSGVLYLEGASGTSPTYNTGNIDLYDVVFDTYYPDSNTLTGTMKVTRNLTLSDTRMNLGWAGHSLDGGVVEVGGDVTAVGAGLRGTTVVRLVGRASGQTVTSQTANYAQGAAIPNLQIATGAHPVTFSAAIGVFNNYQVLSVGTFNNTSTVLYLYVQGYASVMPGPYSYYILYLDGYSPETDLNTQTFTVMNHFYLSVGNSYNPNNSIINGNFMVYGDVTNVIAPTDGYEGVNTATITLAGNPAGQTLTASGGDMPPIIVAAGSNPVTFSGDIVIAGLSYTYLNSGTFTTTGSTLRLSYGAGTFQVRPGNVRYNNVEMKGYATYYNLNAETFYVDGAFTSGDTGYMGEINNGTIEVIGNITFTDTGYGGSGLIRAKSSGSGQTITTTSIPTYMPSLDIDAGANNVTLSGTVFIIGSYRVLGVGTLTTTGSTLMLQSDTTTVNIVTGTEVYNDVVFTGYRGNYELNASTMRIGGNLYIGDAHSSAGVINDGLLQVAGNVDFIDNGHAGTYRITFNGTNQTLASSGGAATGKPSGNITVSLSGTLTLSASMIFNSVGQTFSVTSGAVNMNGNNLTGRVVTLSGGTSITRGGGTLRQNTTIINAGAWSGGTVF